MAMEDDMTVRSMMIELRATKAWSLMVIRVKMFEGKETAGSTMGRVRVRCSKHQTLNGSR